jgi:hypothetical protein
LARVDLARVVDLAAALDADARAGREDLRTRDRTSAARSPSARTTRRRASSRGSTRAARRSRRRASARCAALGALRALLAVAGGLLGAPPRSRCSPTTARGPST